jgi:26S proteasome regulatory subunit T2
VTCSAWGRITWKNPTYSLFASQEIKEAVELPLTHPELYEDIGIKAPKGVILYGCPGTGKTLLAKAVANSTSATFLRVVGSELIQKYLGDGPKLVRELFRVADENSPSIVFIDEIDAIGTKRYDTNSGGEREIQRTMLELLNQLDGFDSMSEVKVRHKFSGSTYRVVSGAPAHTSAEHRQTCTICSL